MNHYVIMAVEGAVILYLAYRVYTLRSGLSHFTKTLEDLERQIKEDTK